MIADWINSIQVTPPRTSLKAPYDLLEEVVQRFLVEPQQGSAWHAYRRGWARARKHRPLPDIAAAGGWKSTEALQRCYLDADEETMLTVVMSGAQLREVRKA